MTPTEINIAIAEVCGWKLHCATRENPVEKGGMRLPNYFENRDSVDAWTHADHPGVYSEPPKYFNDLNAVHEAEKVLGADEPCRYGEILAAMVRRANPVNGFCWTAIARATSAQRCEALLRTLNLWRESKGGREG